MFTMTATKSSTCPVSGLAIEPGDTVVADYGALGRVSMTFAE